MRNLPDSTIKFLSLFAGIGGFDLGLERAGMQCVGQVEIDPFCQKVLSKHWPHVKRIGDIRNVKGDEFGPVELICGGFPCQPFSFAGKREGAEDDRYLWPEMLRVLSICKPTWIIGENVGGIIGVELDTVLSQLESIGYEVQTLVIPACAIGARHRRDRVWIIANAKNNGCERISLSIQPRQSQQNIHEFNRCFTHDIDPDSLRVGLQGWFKKWKSFRVEAFSQTAFWGDLSTPIVCRGSDGIPNRMDRLKSLGNAVVPQVVEVIGRAIINVEKHVYA